MTRGERKSNYELLRILAIICIVASHYAVKSGIELDSGLTINRLSAQMLYLGEVGNNIFMLLMGYFMFGRSVNCKKAWGIVVDTTFYSIIFFLANILLSGAGTSLKEILIAFLPIPFFSYWFSTEYLFVLLLSPVLNRLLKSMDAIMWRYLVILFLTVEVVLLSLFANGSSHFVHFVGMYCLGAYFNSPYCKDFLDNKKTGIWVICSVLIYAIVWALVDAFQDRITILYDYEKSMTDINNVFAAMISISLFLWFGKLQIGYNKLINTIASLTFGVYLIHNNGYVSRFLFRRVFDGAGYYQSKWFLPYSLFVVLAVYLICCAIEWLRKMLLGKAFNAFETFLADKTSVLCERISHKYLQN